MTYQQAGRIAVIKRILGWVIFIPAVLSTLISVLKFMYEHSEKKPGIDAVMMDFAHVMIEMMRFNTPFLNFFWYNSPLPDFHHSLNIGFWIIFILVFVGMALQASGARMARQAKFLREGIEDQLILEQAKGADGLTREQLAERIVVPRHTILGAVFPTVRAAGDRDCHRLLLLFAAGLSVSQVPGKPGTFLFRWQRTWFSLIINGNVDKQRFRRLVALANRF